MILSGVSLDATVDSTYSNSNATITSCVSIFESLWIRTELESQKKVKQAYFKMFKGFELRMKLTFASGHLKVTNMKNNNLVKLGCQ